MSPKKATANGARGSRHAPPTNAFTKGGPPGPGRPKLPADLKAALAADSLLLYEKAKQLAEKAEQEGDLKTAATIVLGLLKKTVPDAQTLLVGDVNGKPLSLTRIDPKTLTGPQLEALLAIQRARTQGSADVRTPDAKEG